MGIEASRILKPGNSILRELESWLQVGFTWTNIHLGSTCCVGYPKTILITAHFYALLKHSLNVHIALTFLLEESATLNWFVLHIPAFARIYPCFFSMFFLWFSHVYPIKLMIHIRFSHWCSRFSEDFPMKIPQHRQFHQVAKAAPAPSQGQNAALASTYLGTCHAATRGHGTNYSYNRGMMIYSS